MPATTLVELVRTGQVSAVELTDAAIAAVEAVNPQLNAVVHERFERARVEAAAVGHGDTRALAGVPIVVKDLDGELAGEPYGAGVSFLQGAQLVSTASSLLFERLIAAGAIIVAKTNTPELGLVPSTEPAATGPTRNPWDPTRSPAGSSGGSAALVAAGAVPIGHAGDGGGSIRLPAAVCGLVGLKPSRGLVATHPDVEPWGGLVARLAVTRTVADTRLVFDVVSTPDVTGSPIVRRLEQGVRPGPLRVGLATDTPDADDVDPECRSTAESVGRALEAAGHHVEIVAISEVIDPADNERRTSAFMTAFAVWTRATLLDLARRSGQQVTEDGVEPHTWALFEAAAAIPAAEFVQALDDLHRSGRRIRSWWDRGFDVLVTPTCPERPWPLGEYTSTPENPLGPLFRSVRTVAFTIPFNISGQPALSIPGAVLDGLPIGVQLVGRWGADIALLDLAAGLEEVIGWPAWRPPVSAGAQGFSTAVPDHVP